MRIAAAPISWGISELPEWGFQLSAERVLREAKALGFTAIEAGRPGFLSPALLAQHGLRLVGGFVPVVLHAASLRGEALRAVDGAARWLAAAGAEVLVLAASTGGNGYEMAGELDTRAWEDLFESLKSVEEIGARYRVTVALHPHFGTVIERKHHVERFLEGSTTGLCLDTGHLALGGADPLDIVAQAADRIQHVHLKDVDRRLSQAVAAGDLRYTEGIRRGVFRPLGDGDVGIDRVVERLETTGYRGWYVLEQDVMLAGEPAEDEAPIPAVQRSLRFLSQARS